jgi:hypothetical protein
MALAFAGGWLFLPRAFFRSVEQPLEFSHKVHGESVGLACADCHAVTGDGRFTGIPSVRRCAECHETPLGATDAEKTLVEMYVKPGREIPWLVYARQPDNVYFSHVQHVKTAALECALCHGDHGTSERLRPYGVDRVSGYSRDLSARTLGGVRPGPAWGLRMDDCMRCHAAKGAPGSCLTCHK